MDKKLIIGLGNIGRDYVNTRHNAGFMALDDLAQRYGFPAFSVDANLKAEISGTMVAGKLVLLVKPTTFMNKSGEAVSAILNYYKLEASDMMVIFDDIDIPLGEIRCKDKGSAGTHNGMRDIVHHLKTTEFKRCKIGIKPDHPVSDLSRFVLGRFSEDEKAAVMREIGLLSIEEMLSL